MRVYGTWVEARDSCLMILNALMLIADAIYDGKSGRRRRKRGNGELRPRGAGHGILADAMSSAKHWRGRARVVYWLNAESRANRASSPNALNEVTCVLAYGDANRETIRLVITCVRNPQQPTNNSGYNNERMLLQRGCTWLTLMPLLLSLSTGELSLYRGK